MSQVASHFVDMIFIATFLSYTHTLLLFLHSAFPDQGMLMILVSAKLKNGRSRETKLLEARAGPGVNSWTGVRLAWNRY